MKPRARRATGTDAVVEEVRRVRRDLWERGGKTVAGYVRLMGELAAKRAAGRPSETAGRSAAAKTRTRAA
ncbi:MAG: hypothetical protein ACKVS8_03555 [Phycisphaerales bacterium]